MAGSRARDHCENATQAGSSACIALCPCVRLCDFSIDARNKIKHLGLKSTADGIREFPQHVLQGELKELANLPNFGRGFYSLSECRDICFHVQEHRFTADSLQELLDTQGLIFCGFMLPETIRKAYQQQFPDDTDMTSLENWGGFETQNPSTFSGMYQFWAYKPN